MKFKEFKISQYQSTIFTPSCLFANHKILAELLKKFTDFFDGETLTFSLPAEAPSEIPRIILQSNVHGVKFEASPARVNVFGYKLENEQDLKNYFSICHRIYECYVNTTHSVVGRLALVGIKKYEIQNPGLELSKYFCRSDLLNDPLNAPLKRADKFELHAYKKYSFDDFTVNSWMRFRSEPEKSLVLVEQDINTLSEDINDKIFDLKSIDKFHEKAKTEHDTILKKYFP